MLSAGRSCSGITRVAGSSGRGAFVAEAVVGLPSRQTAQAHPRVSHPRGRGNSGTASTVVGRRSVRLILEPIARSEYPGHDDEAGRQEGERHSKADPDAHVRLPEKAPAEAAHKV